jgi:hypothetical protein
MVKRIVIGLSRDMYQELEERAGNACRDPWQEATWILIQELKRTATDPAALSHSDQVLAITRP